MTFVKSAAYFDDHNRYIINSYDKKPAFSSFLPGIAGLYGIPLWVFYTNRGQAISSFGIESKDRPLLEFHSATKSYQLTEILGFRTFIKSRDWLAEPFRSHNSSALTREMFIGMNELEIRETDQSLNIETRILYFNLINEPYAGLVRRIFIRNLGPKTIHLEVLDGLPAMMPNGVNNDFLKQIGTTIEAWMQVSNLESGVPYYRLRASVKDTSDVRTIEDGNFALATSQGQLLQPIVDPRLIFGSDTSLRQPKGFLAKSMADLLSEQQISEGRTPSAFFGATFPLEPGKTHQIDSIYGYAKSRQSLDQVKIHAANADYLSKKYAQAQDLPLQLTDPISTKTANHIFDAYCRQTFLDNVMRGGWPQQLGSKHIYYTYSRKHGDPERDYNDFFLAAENFSQGNGNFRDVNQNRRSDIFFQPQTADFNIRLFMSLIQSDGYNPGVVEGTLFSLNEEHRTKALQLVRNPENLEPVLMNTFSPGQILDQAKESGLLVSPQEFINLVFGNCEQHIQAVFGEGYWVDHWTYTLDLIESYLNIFPDQIYELLFASEPLPFFDSPAFVNPRSRKYVLANEQPRQLNAVVHLEEKLALISDRNIDQNWIRSHYGSGDIFRLNLFSKLVFLSLIKFSTRDPFGLGIEMEAGRPGWCDALNGLPGIFGSSMSESFELVRLLDYLISVLQNTDYQANLHLEAAELLTEILSQLAKSQTSFEYWDAVTTAREVYREKTKFGVDGKTIDYSSSELLAALQKMHEAVQSGIEQALEINAGLTPTYFTYQVLDFSTRDESDSENRAIFSATSFKASPLPLYLEGPVHQLKILQQPQERLDLYQKVRKSQLFDSELETYKLNESLQDQPFSIGRARAFSRGWLENESIWMHMTFKYLLEILKAGMYEPFFRDLQKSLPAFLDPDVYGRSPLENSSFIVSSVHPDTSLHGRGFVARLTGASAEFISMWFIMMTGGKPFSLDQEGKLQFSLQPILPGWLFPEQGIIEYRFLGNILVQVHNPSRKNTWELSPSNYVLHDQETELSLNPSSITESQSKSIRDGLYQQIDIYY